MPRSSTLPCLGSDIQCFIRIYPLDNILVPVASSRSDCGAIGKSNQIVPQNEAKGIDICGSNGSKFIIRSDLNCFFEVRFFSQCDDPIIIHPLHPNFMYGDHYLASDSFANYASPYRPRRRWKRHTEPIKRRSLLGGTCRSSPVSSDDSESVLGVPVLYLSLIHI